MENINFYHIWITESPKGDRKNIWRNKGGIFFSKFDIYNKTSDK